MVAIAQKLVVVAATIAALLGALSARLPDAVPTTVPAVCVHVPVLGDAGLQAGYCP